MLALIDQSKTHRFTHSSKSKVAANHTRTKKSFMLQNSRLMLLLTC